MSPKRKSLVAKITLAKRRALADFYYFCNNVLGYDKMVPHVHKEMCAFIIKSILNPRSERMRRLLLEPRGTYKTTVGAIGLPLWLLAHDPNLTILITMEEFSKSKKRLKEIEGHIRTNEKFKALFGDWDADKKRGYRWNEQRIDIATRTKMGGAPSIEVSSTERSDTGNHFNIVICDDLVGLSNYNTPEQLKKVKKYHSEIDNVLDPDGYELVIGTMWDQRDVYNKIITDKNELGDLSDTEILIKAAEKPGGGLFFPEVLSHETLKRKRLEHGSYFYNCQYNNIIVAREDALIQRIDKFDSSKKLLGYNNFVTLDLAFTENDSSDHTAFVVNAVDPYSGKWHIVYYKIMKTADPQKVIEVIFEVERRYNPVRWGIEKNNYISWLKYPLEDAMRKRKVYLNLDPPDGIPHYGKNKSKVMRLRKLAPQFNMGNAAILSDMIDLEDQLLVLTYDGTRGHDDLLDALAMQGEIVFWGSSMPVNKYENESYKPGGETFAQFHERMYGPQDDSWKVASGWTAN